MRLVIERGYSGGVPIRPSLRLASLVSNFSIEQNTVRPEGVTDSFSNGQNPVASPSHYAEYTAMNCSGCRCSGMIRSRLFSQCTGLCALKKYSDVLFIGKDWNRDER